MKIFMTYQVFEKNWSARRHGYVPIVVSSRNEISSKNLGSRTWQHSKEILKLLLSYMLGQAA